jgi:hypothetical protein
MKLTLLRFVSPRKKQKQRKVGRDGKMQKKEKESRVTGPRPEAGVLAVLAIKARR